MKVPSLALALGLAAIGAGYALTAAQSALGGDGGEFAALAIRGGVAHPPGYPLFVMWLRAFSWLPVSEPAHAASLATALLATGVVWLLYRAARAFGASQRSSALAAAIYGAAPLTWKLATYPEVFAGNVAIALAIVWLASPNPPLRGTPRAVLLAMFAGLGIAHHHTVVLLAPLGLYAFVSAVRESPRRAIAIAAALGGLVLGLSPYLYLVLAARGSLGPLVFVWGDPSTPTGLLHHFLRRDYGTLSLGSQARERDIVSQLVLLARTHGRDFLGLPIVVVVSMVAARARVLAGRERTLLLVVALVSGPLFVALFNVPPRLLGVSIVERFHLMPAALFLVFVAPAFDAALDRVKPAIAGLAIVFVAAIGAAMSLPVVAEHHRPTVQRYAENVLKIVDRSAVVVGSGDHRAGSFRYAKAKHVRDDVVYLEPWLLLSPAYHRRMSAELGIALPQPRDKVLDAHALLGALLDSGRSVYVTDWPAPGLEKKFPSYPMGPVLVLIDGPRSPPPPDYVLELNEKAFANMTLDAEPPAVGTWGGALYGDYVRPWAALANAFNAIGEAQAADMCAKNARLLTPR